MSGHDPPLEQRHSPRRWVMLQTRLEHSARVALTQTINVSESGLLIESPPGLLLRVGDRVSVVIEGLIAEQADGESKRSMEVVRVDGHLALRFTTE